MLLNIKNSKDSTVINEWMIENNLAVEGSILVKNSITHEIHQLLISGKVDTSDIRNKKNRFLGQSDKKCIINSPIKKRLEEIKKYKQRISDSLLSKSSSSLENLDNSDDTQSCDFSTSESSSNVIYIHHTKNLSLDNSFSSEASESFKSCDSTNNYKSCENSPQAASKNCENLSITVFKSCENSPQVALKTCEDLPKLTGNEGENLMFKSGDNTGKNLSDKKKCIINQKNSNSTVNKSTLDLSATMKELKKLEKQKT